MACQFVEEVTGYTITIQSFQWGYRQGTEYLQRVFGETGAGVVWRAAIPHTDRQHWSITFDGSRALVEQIRTLTYLVMQYGGRVQFFPDIAQPTVSIMVDWQETLDNSYLADWRHELTLDLRGNLAPVPPPPPNPAYAAHVPLEVTLLNTPLLHIGQAPMEVGARLGLTTVRIAQSPLTVQMRPSVVFVAQAPIQVVIDV